MRILVAQPIDPAAIDWLRLQDAEVVVDIDGRWRTAGEGIDGLICRGMRVDGDVMDALPDLRVIGKHGVGVNTIDVSAATERGIAVTNVPGANTNSVAEHALLLLLAAMRTLVPTDRLVREGRWSERLRLAEVLELRGARLGLVGGGRIGRRIAEIATAGFGCAIGVHDPFLPADALDDLGAARLPSVGALFDWADHVVVAAPVTPANRGAIGTDELHRLGPTGVLVVSSRGGIVDEVALARALREGVVWGAGVDVFEPEPPPADHPLFASERVVVTPHLGAHSVASRRAMGIGVCRHVLGYLRGDEVPLVGSEPWGSPTAS